MSASRNSPPADPVAVALAFAIREAARRNASEAAERRAPATERETVTFHRSLADLLAVAAERRAKMAAPHPSQRGGRSEP